jgi:hypothetical protein
VSEDRGDARRGWDEVPDAVVARAKQAFAFRRPDEELLALVSDAADRGEQAVAEGRELRFASQRIGMNVTVFSAGPSAVVRAALTGVGDGYGPLHDASLRMSLECAETAHGDDVIAVTAEPGGRAGGTRTVFCVPHGVVRLGITDPDRGGAASHTDWFTV